MVNIEEIDRLYNLDFRSPLSAPARISGVIIGSLLICIYYDEIWPISWSIGYTALHLIYFLYLRLGLRRTIMGSLHTAYGLHISVMVSFIWMPVYLMTTGDHTATMIGAALFASLLVLLVRRADPHRGHVMCQAVVLGVSLLILAVDTARATSEPAGVIGIFMVAIVLQYYFLQAWSYTRHMTRDFKEKTIRQAQMEKMASIGRLAGGVAHDFNNHLTALSGNLELLPYCTSDNERRETIRDAMIAAEQAKETVKQLTRFARQEQSDLSVLRARDVMDDLEKIAMRLVPGTIACRFHSSATASFLAIKGQVLNGLLNVISNAIDAMPKGGSIIVKSIDLKTSDPIPLRRRVALPPGTYVEFRVDDTGDGIDDAIVDRVFDDFFTTKPTGKGTGLGLASVAGLVTSFGGGVAIETSPTGTSIRLFIPALQQAA